MRVQLNIKSKSKLNPYFSPDEVDDNYNLTFIVILIRGNGTVNIIYDHYKLAIRSIFVLVSRLCIIIILYFGKYFKVVIYTFYNMSVYVIILTQLSVTSKI